MALDWSKEVSFSGLRRRGSRQRSEYPEKVYMNLVAGEQGQSRTGRDVLGAIAIVLAVALVVKFGIFDFYARVADKQAELSSQKQVLSTVQAAAAEYDDVLAEYESYESASFMDSGLSVGALDAFSLVDRCVSPYARVASFTLSGDTLSLSLASATLDQVGQLVASLEEQDIVSNVLLSTAATQQSDAGEVAATVTVTLQPADATNDGEGE